MSSVLVHLVGGHQSPSRKFYQINLTEKTAAPVLISTAGVSSSRCVSLFQQRTNPSPYFISVLYETVAEIEQRRRKCNNKEDVDGKGGRSGNLISFQILHYDIKLSYVEETEFIVFEQEEINP